MPQASVASERPGSNLHLGANILNILNVVPQVPECQAYTSISCRSTLGPPGVGYV